MARSEFDEWSCQFNKKASEWQKMTREEIFNAGMKWANSHGPASANKPWTKQDNNAFLSMVENGYTATEIAEKLGRSKTAIYGKARYFGVKLNYPAEEKRKTVKLSRSQVGQVRRLRQRGWTRKEVANMFGINLDYVTHITNGFRRSA